jgi:hypothetical protein
MLRPPFLIIFADANSAIWSNASGAIEAIGARNWFAIVIWCLADYRSAIGSSASRSIDATDASGGMSVAGGREHTQTDNDNNR